MLVALAAWNASNSTGAGEHRAKRLSRDPAVAIFEASAPAVPGCCHAGDINQQTICIATTWLQLRRGISSDDACARLHTDNNSIQRRTETALLCRGNFSPEAP